MCEINDNANRGMNAELDSDTLLKSSTQELKLLVGLRLLEHKAHHNHIFK